MFPYLVTGAAIAGGIYFTYQNCCKRQTKASPAVYTLSTEDNVKSFDFRQMSPKTQPNEQGNIHTLYNTLNATLGFFQNETHLKEEGIFRQSGNLNQATSTHTLLRKMSMTYLDQTNPHNATSTLKIALSDSFDASHFLTAELTEKIRQSEKPIGTLFKEHVQQLLNLHKNKEAYILHNLLYLIQRVYEFRADNKMGPQKEGLSNIAIVFSPMFMKLLGMPDAVSLIDPVYGANRTKVSRMIDQLIIDPLFSKPFHECVKTQAARSHFTPR